MNTAPLISILMPVRNTSAYLDDCLASIINQSTENWELLAIDDHSTDHSFEILKIYSARDPRIKVFQNKSRGIIPALQLAYSESQGQLITRMDSDDLMKAQKLEKLKTMLLKKGPGHICIGLVAYFSENELGDGYRKYQHWLNSLTLAENNFADIYKECVIPSPCWMAFREDLTACGAFRPDRYPEDYDLCFRFYQAGLTLAGVKHVLHLWRDYPARTSRTDPNYADQRYFDLKLDYFLKLDYDPGRPLFLWGAGKKGKLLARRLQAKRISFNWVSNNPKKTGKAISGLILEDFNLLSSFPEAQILIAVAAPNDQREIESFLKAGHYRQGAHYYFFC